VVLHLIRNLTGYLTSKFPSIPIYPLLGNHDVWPANEQPDSFSKYYADVLEKTGWDILLASPDKVKSFKQGFYSSAKQFLIT